jgi:hypothetical protein
VIRRIAMPITTLIAAANTIAPATSIRISIQDIAQPHAWKPQPAVRVGAHCRTLAAGKRDAANGEHHSGMLHCEGQRLSNLAFSETCCR